MKPPRILIVCHGNTCRSPMAEGILRKMLGARAEVESAGIDTCEGLSAARHAVEALQQQDIDLGEHVAQSISSLDVHLYDVVVTMTPSIAAELGGYGVPEGNIVVLDIPDPYGGDLQKYLSTAALIEQQLEARFLGPLTEGGKGIGSRLPTSDD